MVTYPELLAYRQSMTCITKLHRKLPSIIDKVVKHNYNILEEMSIDEEGDVLTYTITNIPSNLINTIEEKVISLIEHEQLEDSLRYVKIIYKQ